MRYAMHESDAADGRLFDADRGCALFSQRLADISGDRPALDADEVLYVLAGSGRASIDGDEHELRPGTSVFVSRGTPWQRDGSLRALSVLVHDPAPASATHAVVDLESEEKGSATAGRQFVLGARPDVGCALRHPVHRPRAARPRARPLPPLRRGDLHPRGRGGALRRRPRGRARRRLLRPPPGAPGSLPGEHRHPELRLLGVFRPAGSPAEAYYPDGTPAVVPDEE